MAEPAPGVFFLGARALFVREIVRFCRQPSRLFGAVASPVIFWLLLGFGIGSSFRSSSAVDYRQYFFPGTLLLTLFFTAIFSTITVIEDRREGFLQAVLVSPVPRPALVLGKVMGGASLALAQTFLLLLLAPLAGYPLAPEMVMKALPVLFLNAFFLTALGFAIAWHFESIQGFHSVMNVFLMPMWMLSGSLFPPEGAGPVIRLVMRFNPLTYGLEALRTAITGAPGYFAPFPVSLLVIAASGLLVFGIGTRAVMKPGGGVR